MDAIAKILEGWVNSTLNFVGQHTLAVLFVAFIFATGFLAGFEIARRLR